MQRESDDSCQAPAVAAIVLNWRRPDLLRHCLDTLFAQHGPARVHLVVFDNESTAQGREAIAAMTSELAEAGRLAPVSTTLLSCDTNLGFAAAMNRAVEYARQAFRPDWFWLLNNDVRLEPDALGALLEAGRDQPDWGILGSCIRGETLAGDAPLFGGYRYQPALSRLRPCVRPDQRPDYIAGAAMMVRAEVFAKVGPLSEDFFLFGEELDFARRSAQAGWAWGCAKNSRLWHDSGQSIASRSPLPGRSPQWAREFFENRSALLVTRRHYRRWLPVVMLVRGVVKAGRSIAGQTRFSAVIAGFAAYRRPLDQVIGSKPMQVKAVNLAPAKTHNHG